MDCVTVRAELLAGSDAASQPEVASHLDACERCARVSERARQLDALVRPALLAAPPAGLQARLLALARASARATGRTAEAPRAASPSALPRRSSVGPWRPNVAVAQLATAALVALAGWQAIGWLNALPAAVGDVLYALQVVLASPALHYVGTLSEDLQGLLLWLAVGLVGWMVSEAGPLRSLFAPPRELP